MIPFSIVLKGLVRVFYIIILVAIKFIELTSFMSGIKDEAPHDDGALVVFERGF
jgi:hypothetical protein